MLTERTPGDWRELQRAVAQILGESGFKVELEKVVKTARGRVEIDVYAEEVVKGRRYIILVECKHWRTRVPQEVIHAFRTVVADVGANLGYIVSSAGFQSGAFTAAELTNLKLLTWHEFQDEFERSWYEAHLMPTVTERLDPMFSYTEPPPLLPAWFRDLSEKDQNAYMELKVKYDEFGWMMMRFATFSHLLRPGSDPRIALPLRPHIETSYRNWQQWPPAILDSRGYREFLDASLAFGERIVEQFRKYRPKDVKTDEVDLPRKGQRPPR